MRSDVRPSSPKQWFRHLFAVKSALDGGVVRRHVRDMEHMVGREAIRAEGARRGFTAIEKARQVIVLGDIEPVSIPACRGSDYR